MDKEKSFKEQLEDAQKKQNEELKGFIRDLNIGDPEDINIDYDIDKEKRMYKKWKDIESMIWKEQKKKYYMFYFGYY